MGLQGAQLLPAGGLELGALVQASSLTSWDAQGAALGTAVFQCPTAHCWLFGRCTRHQNVPPDLFFSLKGLFSHLYVEVPKQVWPQDPLISGRCWGHCLGFVQWQLSLEPACWSTLTCVEMVSCMRLAPKYRLLCFPPTADSDFSWLKTPRERGRACLPMPTFPWAEQQRRSEIAFSRVGKSILTPSPLSFSSPLITAPISDCISQLAALMASPRRCRSLLMPLPPWELAK